MTGRPSGGHRERSVIVAMVAVREMQVTVYEVADVIAMRNGLVPASGAVDVPLGMACA